MVIICSTDFPMSDFFQIPLAYGELLERTDLFRYGVTPFVFVTELPVNVVTKDDIKSCSCTLSTSSKMRFAASSGDIE